MSIRLAHHRWQGLQLRTRGFTLAELLVVAAVVAIVATVAVRTTGQSLKREQLNAITVDLYGWLESIQRKAMSVDPNQRQQNPDLFPTCRVTFNSGTLSPGSVLASTPAFCAPGSVEQDGNAVFLLPYSKQQKTFIVQTFNGNVATFSPRGTVTFTEEGSTKALDGPFTLEITRENSSITRCLRMEPLLGFLAVGAMNNQQPTAAQDCPESSFDGAF